MKCKLFPVSLLLCGLMFISMVRAESETGQAKLIDIVAQQNQLRVEVKAGRGVFANLNESERQKLLERQDRVILLLDGKQDLEQLSPADRVTAFNDLEWISVAITKAEDDRQVCKRVRNTGSNRVQTVCTTARQVRVERDSAREALNRPVMCGTSACVDNN